MCTRPARKLSSAAESLEQRTLFATAPATIDVSAPATGPVLIESVRSVAGEPAAAATTAAALGTGLTGEYFEGDNFQRPVLVRTDAAVKFRWGNRSPDMILAAGAAFTVRWTGQIQPTASKTYTFSTGAATGSKLWVNGIQVVDDWNGTSRGTGGAGVALEAGQQYDIRLEYVKRVGDRSGDVQLKWSAPGLRARVIPTSVLVADEGVTLPAGAGLSGTYFLGKNFRQPVMTRADQSINFNWGRGTPSEAVTTRAFSVRWEGQIEAQESGEHTFQTRADDGARLWVDGQLIIDDWRDHSAEIHRGTLALEAGRKYDIRLDYYQNGKGHTSAKLHWANGEDPMVLMSAEVTSNTGMPDAPANVIARAVSTTRVDLNWDAVSVETGFAIERSADGATGWAEIGTTAADVTTFVNEGLQPGTIYYYRLRTANRGLRSAASALASDTTVPPAPGNVLTGATDTTATTTWDATPGATGYRIQRSLNATSGWVTAGTTTDTIFVDAGLALGTEYFYRVVALNGAGDSTPSDVADETTAPPAPGNIAVAAAGTVITLNWDAAPGTIGYLVQESANGNTGWSQVGTTSAGVRTLLHSGLANGSTHFYRVIAWNAAGNSDPSVVVHETAIPATPVQINASAVSTSVINVTWSDGAGETSYRVERSANGSTGWSQSAIPAAGVTTFADTGLTAGTAYHYRVFAINAAGTSAASSVASDVTVPPAPLGLAAVATGTTIGLTWSTASGATSYVVERSANGTTGWAARGSPTSAATFSDTGPSQGTTYYYRVIARNTAGNSVASAIANATTAPATPTGFAAVATGTTVALNWTASINAVTYLVQRSPDGTTGWAAVGAPTTLTTLGDAGLANGTTYHYRVAATNSAGSSNPSTAVGATTSPVAPLNVAAAATGTTIAVTWTAAAGASTYTVERSINGTTGWSAVGSPTASTTLSNASLALGTTYYYRVTAANPAGSSSPSTSANATTVAATPTGMGAVATGTTIAVSWSASTGAASYAVELSLNGTTGWATIGSPTASTTLSDSSLSLGTTYYYRVTATNAAGSSSASTSASGTTAPAAPTGVSAVATGTAIALAWTASPNAATYVVQRSPDGTTGWAAVGSPTASTSANDSSLANGTTFHYRVIATNAAGDSSPSTTDSDTTVPVAPLNVAATAVGTAITVTWTAAAGAATYSVEGLMNGTTGWATVGSATASTSLGVTSLAFGTTFYFRVTATNAAGSSSPSAVVSDTTLPAAPSNVNASASGSTVTVTWSAAAAALTYTVQRSADGVNGWAVVGSPTAGLTLNDTNVPGGATWYYRVLATNAAGNSGSSANRNVNVMPLTPANVAAVAIANDITVSWTASAGATGYTVEDSANGTTGWSARTTSGTSLLYFTLPNGSTSYYRVTANSAVGDSAASGVVSATIVPDAPGGMNATPLSDTIMTLTWSDVPDETGYVIERSADGTTGWTTTGSVGADINTFTVGGLTASTTYYFRVRATNAGGQSDPSNVAAGITNAPIPLFAAQTSVYGLDAGANVSLINTSTGAASVIGTMLFATAAGGRDPVSGKFYYVESGTSMPRLAVWDPADDTNVLLNTLSLTGTVARAGFHPDGTFYIMAGNSALYSIDRTTGAATALGAVSPSFSGGGGDLAFAPDGTLWVTVDGSLYTVDVTTRAVTLQGNPGISNFQMAFGQNGVMYGAAGSVLYSINLATMAATTLGATGNFSDMASSPLYADLTVTQSTTPLNAGQNSAYTITVANNGPQATTAPVTVIDTLPAGVSLVSAGGNGWTFYQSGQTVTMIYATPVAANTTLPLITLTVAVDQAAPTSVINTAEVSTTLFDMNTSNNSSSLTSPVGQPTINLGSASTFAVMATASITATGPVLINGDVALHPGTAQGISSVNGTIHVGDAAAIAAQADLLAAYNDAASRTTGVMMLPASMDGLTLAPGLYQNATSAGLAAAGVVTLDAQGDPNAVFIFKMGTTLVTGAGASVVLTGSARASNVFWQVGSSATLGAATTFKGSILASVSIGVGAGSNVEGRLLGGSSTGGSVVLDSSTVTVPTP